MIKVNLVASTVSFPIVATPPVLTVISPVIRDKAVPIVVLCTPSSSSSLKIIASPTIQQFQQHHHQYLNV